MTQLKMLSWVILILQCMQLVWSCEEIPYLYYTTYGTGWVNSAGLYGGPIHVHASRSDAVNLTKVGIRCANLEGGDFQEGLEIYGISYDAAQRSVLVQQRPHSYFDGQSVFTTRVCERGPPTCQNSQTQAIFVQAQARDENYANAVGPFAMHDGKIYFVADRYERVSGNDAKHVIEIRQLEGCEDRYPFYHFENELDVSACSNFVGVVAEQVGHYRRTPEDMAMLIRAFGNLHVVRHGAELGFLIQVATVGKYDYRRDDIIDFTMPLIFVKHGEPTELHAGRMETIYGRTRRIPHQGGISFRDDVLCWTVVDRILCAEWDGSGELQNVITVLTKSTALEVCTGPRRPSKWEPDNIVTGVAIADTADDVIKLFFGCHTGNRPQERGGAGFVRIGKDGRNRVVQQVGDDAGPIHAGSLFIGCE